MTLCTATELRRPAAVAETLYATAYLALTDGRAEEAQRYFSLMASVAPFDARPWVGLGASLEQLGKWKRALGVYTLGRTLDPSSVFCKLGEARMLARTGHYAKAQCVLDTAEVHANEDYEVQLIDRMRGEL